MENDLKTGNPQSRSRQEHSGAEKRTIQRPSAQNPNERNYPSTASLPIVYRLLLRSLRFLLNKGLEYKLFLVMKHVYTNS